MSSLADFGAKTWEPLREIAKNDDGEVVCPVSKTPIDYSHGMIHVPTVRLVDDALCAALEDDCVEYVRSRGYESPKDVLFPETVGGPDAHGWSSKWTGVRAEFTVGERWIPVLVEDLPVVDAARESSDATVATDGGDDDGREDEPEPETRVGHTKRDDTDVYIGRGPDGADFLDFLDGNLDAGARGWLGNPHTVDEFGREKAVGMFLDQLDLALERDPELRRELVERCRGKRLGCWCQRLDDDGPKCHGEVIAAYVDRVLVHSGGESA